jgi:hypothetical protein
MARYTIRYRQDGEGWWYEIRDPRRRLVGAAWRAGHKSYAKDEARRRRDNMVRALAAKPDFADELVPGSAVDRARAWVQRNPDKPWRSS